MIAEAFLTAALALPASQFHPSTNNDDVKVIRMLTEYPPMLSHKRVLIISENDDFDWLLRLRRFGISAWRLVSKGDTLFDITGSLFMQPIRPESLQVVIFIAQIPFQDPGDRRRDWKVERVVKESTQGLEIGGLFVFDPDLYFKFSHFLPKERWSRLPMRWHELAVYRKLPPSTKQDGEDGEAERPHGSWESWLKTGGLYERVTGWVLRLRELDAPGAHRAYPHALGSSA